MVSKINDEIITNLDIESEEKYLSLLNPDLNKIGLFAFNIFSITIFLIPAFLFFNAKLTHKILSLIFVLLMLFFFQ